MECCWTMRHLAIHLMVTILVCPVNAEAQSDVRARDLGVPLEGTPGEYNVITDVSGTEVGHVTLISGSGRRIRGEGPIRTGVTAILPRGKANLDPVFAGWTSINGNGEITGTEWIEESGYLNGPIMLTNSFNVGIVRDAVIEWQLENAPDHYLALPVVGETSDRLLNDRSGFHVRKEHAFEAIRVARSGAVAEGGVGAGAPTAVEMLPNGGLNPLFEATIQATEEAILNSLIGAETMVGADYIRVQALPHDRLREMLRRYNRLADQR